MTPNFTSLHIFAADYSSELSWRLVRWCRKHGADEWTVARLSVTSSMDGPPDMFLTVMNPYSLEGADRRHLSATRQNPFVRSAELWRLNAKALSDLTEFLPDGLFSYSLSDSIWTEDPIIYRSGELMLGVVSHEQEGILSVTETERQELENEGFPFRTHGAYVGY